MKAVTIEPALVDAIGDELRAHASQFGVASTVALLADTIEAPRLRRMKRGDRVRRGRGGSAKTPCQPRHLGDPAFDQGRRAYLALRELLDYLRRRLDGAPVNQTTKRGRERHGAHRRGSASARKEHTW